jgi:hypothetical protein
MKDKKYVFRLELNRTTFGNGEELYRYDVYEPYLKNYPDGYNSFMDDNYDGPHISSADNGNVHDYPYFFGEGDEEEMEEEHGIINTENIDEFGAFESYEDMEAFIEKDASERFS